MRQSDVRAAPSGCRGTRRCRCRRAAARRAPRRRGRSPGSGAAPRRRCRPRRRPRCPVGSRAGRRCRAGRSRGRRAGRPGLLGGSAIVSQRNRPIAAAVPVPIGLRCDLGTIRRRAARRASRRFARPLRRSRRPTPTPSSVTSQGQLCVAGRDVDRRRWLAAACRATLVSASRRTATRSSTSVSGTTASTGPAKRDARLEPERRGQLRCDVEHRAAQPTRSSRPKRAAQLEDRASGSAGSSRRCRRTDSDPAERTLGVAEHAAGDALRRSARPRTAAG